ncbi:MAG: hypothetical protein IJ660_04450 [Alphaproteobacteria bacterium]|nr:hypothetical protein [Alphaproteobacteria bacterium]
MLDSSGKIAKNYKLMGTESDPVIIAQRLLNLYRQLHIFSPEKKEAYNKMLLEQPVEIKRLIGTLPGGVVVQQYLADLEKEAGITDESFEQSTSTNAEAKTFSATGENQEQPRVIVQSAASPEMAHEIAKAFKEALVTSDKNRKEDTKELAQTLMALQSKLTQTILEKQNKNTTESQSELIKTITHTQTQEFSAIISQALKEIRQMSNDALIEAIQKVHSENLDFFKNQIFSTVSPMPMSAHYDAKMQEYNDKYNAADDAVSLDEYVETPSPIKETAVDDISEDDYYQEMSKHQAEAPEEAEEETTTEEIDESLLGDFDGTPEDLFENDTEWKSLKEEPIPEDKDINPEEKTETPATENENQEETAKEDKAEKEEIQPEDANLEVSAEQEEPKENQENIQSDTEVVEENAENGDEEYEWEYVDEDEGETENVATSDEVSALENKSPDSATTEVQAAYNILESVDEDSSNDEEYEWEYVDEEGEAVNSDDSGEEYEWEYVEDDGSEETEEYDFDADPYNPDVTSQSNNRKNALFGNNVAYNLQEQQNDNIILDEGFGISSNDDN